MIETLESGVSNENAMKTLDGVKMEKLPRITAKNGLGAIEQLEVHLPHVIVPDIEMPKMDGFEAATHIRKQAAPVGTQSEKSQQHVTGTQ